MDLALWTRSKGLNLCISINRIEGFSSERANIVNLELATYYQTPLKGQHKFHQEYLRGQILSLDIPIKMPPRNCISNVV